MPGTYNWVWDATADLGEGTVLEKVTVNASCEAPLGGVQLWEDGPYWAECNVGASKSEEYGYYFWWGDTVGYTWDGGTYDGVYPRYTGVTWVSSKGVRMGSSPFSWSSCPTYSKDTSELRAAKYINSTGNLVAAYDAATAHLGAPWRMPTDSEFSALINNCTTTWTTRNGVFGMLVKGRNDYSSKSIFIPAAGLGDGSDLNYPGRSGYYCSSTRDPSDSFLAQSLGFSSGLFGKGSVNRYCGCPVRPVRGVGK